MSEQIILFGAGVLGRWTLLRLRSIGVEPLGFSDNNRELWGTKIDGLSVFAPPAPGTLVQKSQYFVVVTIYNGSAVRKQLADLGVEAIRFTDFARQYPVVMLPGWNEQIELPDEVNDTLDLWADQASKDEYQTQLRYRLNREDIPSHSDPAYIYFPFDLFAPSGSEVFVDCGAYDGDTIRLFKSRWRWWEKIIAIEPNPLNFDSLQRMPGLSLMLCAVGRERGKMPFTYNGPASAITDTAPQAIDVIPLDDLLKDEDPTFIKLDVEGSELDAINGAQRILQNDEPILAVCLYHKQADLWKIPLRIKEINPSYHLFLRRYAEDCWEQVCYAIPSHRLRREVARTVACPGAFAE